MAQPARPEIVLTFKVQDWKELKDVAEIMMLLPKLRTTLALDEDIANLQKRAEELKEEIRKLESERSSLLPTPTTPTPTITVSQT